MVRFLIMAFVMMMPFFTGYVQLPGEQAASQQSGYLGLECIEAGTDSYYIQSLYLEKLEEWKGEGYIPLIVQKDDFGVMEDSVSRAVMEYGSMENYAKGMLEKAKRVDADQFFEENRENYELWMEWVDEEAADPDYSWEDDPDIQSDLYLPGYGDTYLILKVPAKEPYEVLAYVPFGGYNECPLPEEHIAVAKRWYELYGAVPCAVGYDTLQYYLEEPVTDREAVEKLSEEMMIYCADIVFQGVGNLDYLKASIKGSPFWFFWWD